YRPIYQKMSDVSSTSDQQELVDQKTINRSTQVDDAGTAAITETRSVFDSGNSRVTVETKTTATDGSVTETVKAYTLLSDKNRWIMVLLVVVQVVMVTMVYGPIAAFLVELFPTRIRYTSMSLPYHIGNGMFGGLTPLVATSLYVASKNEANPDGDPLAGLWYPILVAGITLIVGMLFLKKRSGPIERSGEHTSELQSR